MTVAATVLIVDDNPVDREAVVRLLGREYECLVAATGTEGLELCHRVDPACVLLDYRLPDRDGIEWLPLFLEARVGVVMITGAEDRATEIASLRGGAHDYLTKSELSRMVLERAIRNAVEKADLMRELELHQRLVAQMPIGVVLLRLEDEADPASLRFLWQNPAAQRVSGAGTEHLGKTLSETFPDLLATPIPALCQKTVLTGEAQSLSEVAYGDSRVERSVFDLKTVPLGGDVLAALFEDVSARIAALEAHHQMEDQMRAAQRLEAVGRLAGGVAHDFNNVLTVIQSYAGFLSEDLEPADARQEDVAAILDASHRAARLTSQLLAFSRRQIQELRIIDLNEVVRDVDKLLRRLIGEDIDLSVRLAEDLGSIAADRTHLEQVVVNLAVNARDAMPGGGELTIETENVELDASHSSREHVDVEPGRYVMLAVTDDGHGMDEETRQHVFEPFFTTKSPDRGTGLGLSTVFGIVKQSNGYVWVHSEVDRGTRFEVYLPQVDGTPAPSVAPRAPAEALHGTETLLVVEDDPQVRPAVCRTLRAHGYEVLDAADGVEALALARAHAGPIHLLLSDVVMPSMSGPELSVRVRELYPQLRVIYMSGYTKNETVDQSVVDGRVAFLAKPFASDAVLRKVREQLDATGD